MTSDSAPSSTSLGSSASLSSITHQITPPDNGPGPPTTNAVDSMFSLFRGTSHSQQALQATAADGSSAAAEPPERKIARRPIDGKRPPTYHTWVPSARPSVKTAAQRDGEDAYEAHFSAGLVGRSMSAGGITRGGRPSSDMGPSSRSSQCSPEPIHRQSRSSHSRGIRISLARWDSGGEMATGDTTAMSFDGEASIDPMMSVTSRGTGSSLMLAATNDTSNRSSNQSLPSGRSSAALARSSGPDGSSGTSRGSTARNSSSAELSSPPSASDYLRARDGGATLRTHPALLEGGPSGAEQPPPRHMNLMRQASGSDLRSVVNNSFKHSWLTNMGHSISAF